VFAAGKARFEVFGYKFAVLFVADDRVRVPFLLF
jgi:hypothetical protein